MMGRWGMHTSFSCVWHAVNTLTAYRLMKVTVDTPSSLATQTCTETSIH